MSKSLTLVLDLRQKEEDQALAHLAQARQAMQQLQDKYNRLAMYRRDYLGELQQKGSLGMKALNMSHYQHFVARLDDGLGELTNQLEQSRQVVAQREHQWRQARQATKAIELLLERQAQKHATQQQRREQRELDDLVNRRLGTPIA